MFMCYKIKNFTHPNNTNEEKMKPINALVPQLSIFALLSLILLTPGCSKKQEAVKTEEIRPVKTIVVKAPDAGGIRHFPGRIDANRKADLAFRISGKVQELFVKEGDFVKAGDLLAKLDFPLEVEYIKASSYSGTHSTGTVKTDKKDTLKENIRGKNILLIDDIYDTGRTLSHILEWLNNLSEQVSVH